MRQPPRPSDFENVDEPDVWEIPFVEDPNDPVEKRPTNALNLRSEWKYEPPEPEEEIKPPTAEEIEAIRAAAYEEGFAEGKSAGLEQGTAQGIEEGHKQGLEQGHEEGLAKGFEEGKQQAEEIAQTLESIVEHIYQPLAQVNAEVKTQVTQLAVTLAKSVLLTELETNRDVISSALEKGLAALPLNETHIQIHLNPDDIPLIEQAYGAEKLQQKGWDIVEKPGLSRGGCEIISQNNAVDVSVERRTRDVIDKFLTAHGLADESS